MDYRVLVLKQILSKNNFFQFFCYTEFFITFATAKPNNGTLAEWLGNGLQNRVQRFESARYLRRRSSNRNSFFRLRYLPLNYTAKADSRFAARRKTEKQIKDMAKNATTHEEEKDLENLQSALSSTESFIEKNQKVLTIILCAILLIIAVWLLVENLYVLPKEDKANELIVAGQTYFQNGDYETAVNGDSISFDGFIAINKEYGFTKAGNLAAAYAGLAYYKMGNYDMALEYLNKFNGKDDVMKYTILGTIGDCYAQKGDAKKAVEYFLKAAKSDNILVAPVYKVKAGVAYESLGEYGKALDLYNEVKKDATPAQRGIPEVDDIDKYITSATIKNGK